MNEELIHSSFKYCEEVARNHYENFPVASRLIPEGKRKYIYSIYAFARAADDFADEPGAGLPEDRLRLISNWNDHLRKCYSAYDPDETQPVFIALRRTIEDCSIPIDPLENLLKAFAQDVVKNRYQTFGDVLSYCENSANPVGRLVLMILGAADEKYFEYSDFICTALQLTNFWQDLEIDLRKDRVYVPSEDMAKFGYTETMLFNREFSEPFRNMLKFEIDRTQDMFMKGKKLFDLISNENFVRELKLTWLGGMEILKKIRRNNYDVFSKRPTIGKIDAIKLFAEASIT